MLIGICGGICAGKKTVAQYLVDHHGFKHLHLEPPSSAPSIVGQDASSDGSEVNLPDQLGQHTPSHADRRTTPAEHIFATAQALLDYVTSRWQDRWVLTHVHSEAVLDLLSRRPFFLLISVDAPLTLRWRRFQALPAASHPLARALPDLEAFAGRERIRDGAVLYCDTCPCLTCSIKVCQVGIREVVYAQGYSMDIETAAVFREAGVKLRQFVPPPNGLIQLENVDKLDLY
ncbi:hypothetical protein VdG1_05481 [Verticillium dahliae VDG1]|nr:hypothetical protein VdG1_05481 [Verticillium dahliae VDG1]